MTATAARTPNASHISRTLNKAGLTKRASGKNSGYVVTTEHNTGKVINHATGLPDSYRYPFVSIRWENATVMEILRSLLDPGDDLAKAEQALTDAGYHIQRITTVAGIRFLIALPQEMLDWIAERDQRAENAEQVAEQMIPACDQVHVYQADYPSSTRYDRGLRSRAWAVDATAQALRRRDTDILNPDLVRSEERTHHLDPAEGTVGMRHVTSARTRRYTLLRPVN